MAYISVIAREVQALLKAKEWECEAHRFTIRAVEPAVDPIKHTWMAGKSTEITISELGQNRPTRLIVEDLAARDRMDVLRHAGAGWGMEVVTRTRFIDHLWGARKAAERARIDAATLELPYEELKPEESTDVRHVTMKIEVAGSLIPDHRLIDRAVATAGATLAVLGDAGLGKTELFRWLEWRHAVFYEADSARGSAHLPPVVLRVPLREMRLFSIGAVAEALSKSDAERGLPPLRLIDNGAVLLELLRMERVILLLDGLDELSMSREALQEDLKAWRSAISQGARVLFSTRSGHFVSAASVRAQFASHEIGEVQRLETESALELLEKYGATPTAARQLVKSLAPSVAVGIPLFLLLAFYVGLNEQLDPEVSESRTLVLLELLSLFCKRDEPRLGVPSQEQMDSLTSLAHWMNLEGELQEEEALQLLGVDPDENLAALVRNPHALLSKNSSGAIVFKYPEIGAIFAARAIVADWRSFGFRATLDDLRQFRLEEATVEYLARLIDEERLRNGWTESGDSTYAKYPLIRRNLLAIAIAKLNDLAEGDTPQVRADLLSRLTGGKSLRGCNLSGITIERVDFRDWDLRSLAGRGGALLYCPNLGFATTDNSIATLDTLEGSEVAAEVDRRAEAEKGVVRLVHMLSGWQRKGDWKLIRLKQVAQVSDASGWACARKFDLVEQKRRHHGAKFWILTSHGHAILSTFSELTATKGTSSQLLKALLEREPVFKEFLIVLGKGD